ncbi:MAG TPA: AAA family ATPase [Stenomitos sp.]
MAVRQSTPMALVGALRRVVAAPEATLKLVVAAAVGGGHLLLEDVPGVGKTLLAKTLAKALGVGFRRIQFSPDLLPGDLTGVQVYLPSDGSFRFTPGPLFSHVVLADEINRASPRTQSGLLEAMEEGQVSIDGVTHDLPRPFFVIATQNPVSFEGTYPLPEVQLDRFIAALSLGYPSYEDELALLEGQHGQEVQVEAFPAADLLEWQQAASRVHVDPSLRAYALAVVRATRNWPEVALGISPRGALAWQGLARAHAYVEGRDFLVPDDLKQTALPALAHRLLMRGESTPERKRRVIAELLEREPVPR